MNLAAILAVYVLSLGRLPPTVHGFAAQTAAQQMPAVTASNWPTPQSQDTTAPSQPQTPPPQSPDSTQPSPSPTGPTQNSTGPAKPPLAKAHRHRKKTIPPNCSNSPTALNPAVGNPADATNSSGPGSTDAGSTSAGSTSPDSTNPGSMNPGSMTAGSTNAGSAALKPCPPPKKVVRNGGSAEPTVQLTGGTTAEQAVHQRSTEQLTAATQENLKKIAGRQLNPSQQEMVSQIKQFMAQSKTAVAAGDLGRGHDLALKAHLLSDELVKP
jgi:hypothetical protein